jgi:hypothetical protein
MAQLEHTFARPPCPGLGARKSSWQPWMLGDEQNQEAWDRSFEAQAFDGAGAYLRIDARMQPHDGRRG